MGPEPDDDREAGFIVLHRRMLSWPLWQRLGAEHRLVWLYLLFSANWKNSEVWTRKGRLVVQRGQAFVAQRTLAKEAGVSYRNVRTALELLTQEGAIQVAQVPTYASRTASLVTIVNYEKYQNVAERDDFERRPKRRKGGPIRTRGTTNYPDPEISSPVSPSVERGDVGVLLCPEAWRERRNAQLEAQYGKGT